MRRAAFYADCLRGALLFGSPINWAMVGLVVVFFSLPYALYVIPLMPQYMVVIGAVCTIIMGGLFCSYLLDIIRSVASGEDRLPEFSEYHTSARGYAAVDFHDTVFVGAVTFLWALLTPVSPWIAWRFLGGMTGLDPSVVASVGWALGLGGVCLIPMTIIAAAWGGVGMVFRVDVLLRGAFASPLAYLSLIALLAGTFALCAALLAVRVPAGSLPNWLQNVLGTRAPYHYVSKIPLGRIPVVLEFIATYTTVVMAVLLGLFQRHFGAGLPWGAEHVEREFVPAKDRLAREKEEDSAPL